MENKIKVLDIFTIVGNDDLKQWEFTPNIDGYTSYTVSYSECDSKADACIAVWKSITKKSDFIAGNKAIAEFMGADLREDDYGKIGYCFTIFPTNWASKWWSAEALQYHSSWDWLMPAWGKFRQNVWDMGNGYSEDFDHFKERFMSAVFNEDVADAFLQLTLAIKWYNQQQSLT